MLVPERSVIFASKETCRLGNVLLKFCKWGLPGKSIWQTFCRTSSRHFSHRYSRTWCSNPLHGWQWKRGNSHRTREPTHSGSEKQALIKHLPPSAPSKSGAWRSCERQEIDTSDLSLNYGNGWLTYRFLQEYLWGTEKIPYQRLGLMCTLQRKWRCADSKM